jgi:predicted transcriptional regulator
MHLTKNQQLFGYPALEIRRLMFAGANRRWTLRLVTLTLGVQLDEAAKLVEKLLEEGFIAVHSEDLRYELTTKGRALAMASAKPIRALNRGTARF